MACIHGKIWLALIKEIFCRYDPSIINHWSVWANSILRSCGFSVVSFLFGTYLTMGFWASGRNLPSFLLKLRCFFISMTPWEPELTIIIISNSLAHYNSVPQCCEYKTGSTWSLIRDIKWSISEPSNNAGNIVVKTRS